jgi:superoxide dismutase
MCPKGGKLEFAGTPNQDNPLITMWLPNFGMDVWEHAYYLHKTENRLFRKLFQHNTGPKFSRRYVSENSL